MRGPRICFGFGNLATGQLAIPGSAQGSAGSHATLSAGFARKVGEDEALPHVGRNMRPPPPRGLMSRADWLVKIFARRKDFRE